MTSIIRLSFVALFLALTPLALAGSVTVEWIAPTENEDGSPATLSGFEIEYQTTTGGPIRTMLVSNPAARTQTIDGVDPGAVVVIAMRAIGDDGQKSYLSNVVRLTAPGVITPPPPRPRPPVVIDPVPPVPPVAGAPTLTGWLVEGWTMGADLAIPARAPDAIATERPTVGYPSSTGTMYLPTLGADNYIIRGRRLYDLPAGTYAIRYASDDGVRIWVGDQQIVENWQTQAATFTTATFTHAGGVVEVRVEHYEGDWIASLSVEDPVLAP